MKKSKRIVSLIMTITMMISILPILQTEVKAIETISTADFIYEITSESTVKTYECTSSASEIEIPSQVKGYTVTDIGEFTFDNCHNTMQSIIIPDTVTKIEKNTFYGCTLLERVNFPSGLKSIGATAFSQCQSLKSITLPDGLERIGEGAFFYATNLISVEIPDSVTDIGHNTFGFCKSLEKITLSNSLTKIEQHLFINCEKLREIIVPDSVASIGNSAFVGCTSLQKVSLSNNLKSIEEWAFGNCSQLEEIKIPDSVERISICAFYSCASLRSVKLSENLTRIENTIFSECVKLRNIHIPSSVIYIGDAAFYNCDSLQNIFIPENVSSIGIGIFYDCDALEEISVSPLNITYSSLDGDLYDYDKKTIISYAEGKNEISFTIPDGVTKIATLAFNNCDSLQEVQLPDSMKQIENSAFSFCTALSKVNIPQNVEQIGSYAFNGCQSLSEIRIPKNVTTIGDSAIPKETTIYGYRNSAAEKYAEKNGNKFIYLGIRHLAEEPELLTDDTIKFALYNKEAIAEANVFDNHYADYTEVENAHVRYSDYDIQLNDSKIEIDYDSIDTALCFQGEDYRNYTIPQEVIESWKTNEERTADIYMAKDTKDGKPYVSTVFARVHTADNVNKYVEVQTNKVQLLKNETYDVIITAEGIDEGAEYYLSQDTTHKVYNNTGIFTKMDLYNRFEKNKKIYAYVKTADGITSEPIEIHFEKYELNPFAENLINKSSFSLFGPERGANYFTIPDTIPLIGGAGIGMSNVTFPIRFEVDNDRVKCVFGVNLYKNSSGSDAQKITDFNYFKEQFDKYKAVEKAESSMDDKWKAYKLFKDNKLVNIADALVSKNNNFNMDVLGYAEGYLTESGFVFTNVSGSFASDFAFQYTQQGAVWVVPAYFYVRAGAKAMVDVHGVRMLPDTEVPLDFGINLKINPFLRLGGGAGVKGVGSAGIYGKGSLPYEDNLSTKYRKMVLEGEFGVEGEFFILRGNMSLLNGSVTIFDGYYGTSKAERRALAPLLKQSDLTTKKGIEQDNISLISREYLETTSDWLGTKEGSAKKVRRNVMTPTAVDISDLQTSVYANSQCQLVTFGDKMMMAWIEDCGERDTYNRMRLVYSVYSPQTDTWSAPKAVADNGHLDSAPSLASDGTNVYIAWQNIDSTITEADTSAFQMLLENSEIMFAKYDEEADAFTQVKKITENQSYDYAPCVSVENGTAVVYWANSAANRFAAKDNSILKNVFGGNNEAVYTELNYIQGICCNNKEVTYTMDVDGNLETANDFEIYTNGRQVTSDSEENGTKNHFTYGMLEGKNTLFYADSNNLHYVQNGEIKDVFEESRRIGGNLQILEADGSTIAIWSELTEEGSEFFTCKYENGTWNRPVSLSDMGALVSNLSAVYYNHAVRAVFNRTERIKKTEEDGQTYYESGLTDLCQMKSKGFTDFEISSISVDESRFVSGKATAFDVAIQNNGTETIEEVQFEICDGLGNVEHITKNVNLLAGETDYIELNYVVPENLKETTLSVKGTVSGDIDTSNNTAECKIGYSDISVDTLKIQQIGNIYKVTGIVTNNNCVKAEGVTADVSFGSEDSEDIMTIDIGTMQPKQSYSLEVFLSKSDIQFEDGAYMIYVKTNTTTEEWNDVNNKNAIAIIEYGTEDSSEDITGETTAVEINGYQINASVGGIRTVYSVEPEINGQNVVERGLVYGLADYASMDEMYVGAETKYVIHSAATARGLRHTKDGTSPTADSYAMTMLQDIGRMIPKGYTAKYYVRAYAVLQDGTYVYSPIEKYSIFSVAKTAYDNKLMNSEAAHDYLYDKILSVVDIDYPKVEYPYSGGIYVPGN